MSQKHPSQTIAKNILKQLKFDTISQDSSLYKSECINRFTQLSKAAINDEKWALNGEYIVWILKI